MSPDVGSEQRELDLKGPPHFHLQVKGIVLQIKESVHHSPDTCSTARVSMMFEVPPWIMYHHLVTFPSVPVLNFLFTLNTLSPTSVRRAIEFTTVGTVHVLIVR